MAKVLIIEDDPLVSRMYQKVLTLESFIVESARDGKGGLAKAKTCKPDLILLDIMMPEMNGIEVLEKLKADPALQDIPVIMLTNLSGTKDAETAMQMGALDYLVKSEYKPKEVAQKARAILSRQSQPQPTKPPVQPQLQVKPQPPVPASPAQLPQEKK